jgi:hypothetical protein
MLGLHRFSPFMVRRASLVGYYPFIGRDSPEIDVIGGNSLTVTGTTASVSDPPTLWLPGQRRIFLPAQSVTVPAFSVPPSVVNVTENAYTLGFTATVASTFKAVAVRIGSTVPSKAQIKAGQDSTGAAALAAASEDVGTGAETTILGGALTRRGHDLHTLLTNVDGDSAIASIGNALMRPPAGWQYVSLVEPGGGWSDQSFPHGASPAAVTGDVLGVSAVTKAPGGLTVVIGSDGIMSYTGSASRQLVDADLYDVSTDSVSAVVEYDVNNQSPAVPTQTVVVNLTINVAMTPRDMRTDCSDPESDPLTATGTPPTGTSISNSIWSGTPTAAGTTVFAVTVTDSRQRSSVYNVQATVGGVAVPNVVNAPTYDVSQNDAITALEAAQLVAAVNNAYSTTVDAGFVMAQSPAATTVVAPGSTVVITVSLGDPPVGGPTRLAFGVPKDERRRSQ